MQDRKQEKQGWTFGWHGGFVVMWILSVIQFVRGNVLAGLIGLLIAASATTAILLLAPWRHPRTPYRQLMAPIYLILLCALAWSVWAFGRREVGFTSWWTLLALWPTFLPFFTMGGRRWDDPDARQHAEVA